MNDQIRDATCEMLKHGDTMRYNKVEYLAYDRKPYSCEGCAFNESGRLCLPVVCNSKENSIGFKVKQQELIW